MVGNINKSKKGQIYSLWSGLSLFSLISTIIITIGYFIFIIGNDYIVYPMNFLIENQTIFSEQIIESANFIGQSYQQTNLQMLDYGFLISYMVLIITSFKMAYESRQENNFSFLALLFYGTILSLFVFGIILVLSKWIFRDFLVKITENIILDLPFFTRYMTKGGVIFLIHSVLLLLVNKLDFDLALMFSRKRKEEVALEKDDEMV